MTAMLERDIEAIAGGYHGDAFSVLGPHASGDHWEVCAFLPDAAGAELLFEGRALAMRKVHPDGVFVAPVPTAPHEYRLRLTLASGAVVERDDPYRFPSMIGDADIFLYGEGNNYECFHMLGSHLTGHEGVHGVRFAVWAPSALCVFLCGQFNRWNVRSHPMRIRDAGIWEIFMPGMGENEVYKYFVSSRFHGYSVMKTDPVGFKFERPPQTAAIVTDISKYEWRDAEWMERRAKTDWLSSAINIYEVHLESWMRGEGGRTLTYGEIADRMVPYIVRMGFTHIELMPITEHPFTGSWGYQVTGFFAPTSRFGSPAEFKEFVDRFHQAGIGVLLDWVPGHFPKDAFGLVYFDGTHLYEHADPRQGEHLTWGTMIFNYERNEVRSFLLSSAMFWLKEYHIDGLRVDAVASMLYLDYDRKEGEWLPNRYGGRENIAAIGFLRQMNELAHTVPGAITIAEESTSFAMVSKPTWIGGLGFTLKWNMGWMHDMFHYFKLDPFLRKFNQNDITFSLMYAFTENFVLPISHDEVVHMKGSLIGKMPGDEWRKFANTRAFLGYMYTHPGKKLLFMGQEIGQYEEWNESSQVRWELVQFDYHRKLQSLVADLNRMVREEPCLHEVDFHWDGFQWIDFKDIDNSSISFVRRGRDPAEEMVVVCNFTPNARHGYRMGVPTPGVYDEALNTDWDRYGGSGISATAGFVESEPVKCHGRDQSIVITLPPLAVVLLKRRRPEPVVDPLMVATIEAVSD